MFIYTLCHCYGWFSLFEYAIKKFFLSKRTTGSPVVRVHGQTGYVFTEKYKSFFNQIEFHHNFI